VVESELLAGNPLGDPARRPLYVYVPPGLSDDGSYPSIYLIQGFTGQLDMWSDRDFLQPNIFERLDRLFEDRDVPRAVVVFVDAWTSYGGSQFINSIATGPYMDYLCDEVVPFIDSRYPTAAERDRRGLTGKSSGGYGAMVVPMLRPDVFGALASHAGDALFEVCYIPAFREVVRTLRDHYEGSYDRFFEVLPTVELFDYQKHIQVLEMYAYATCYSPDPARPGKALLPFEVDTGRLVDDVWQQWLGWDPVRMAPKHLDALASMRLIYLDAGKRDEPFLDLAATAFAKELDKGNIEYGFELFDAGHMGISFRYPLAIRSLAETLST
jgi:enterochelin esterase-like enzyme